MLRIAVCDDNKDVISFIESFFKASTGHKYRVCYFESGYALSYYVAEVARGAVDVIITDIDLKELNGVDIAKSILREYPHIKIIYMSGYPKYIQRVFETEPVYFLTKPLHEDHLIKALNKVAGLIEIEQNSFLNIITKSGVVRLPHKSINYITSSGRLTIVHESGGTREFYNKLDDVERELPKNFLRCHKSYLVNLDKVKSMNEKLFVLTGGETVPISQSQHSKTKDFFLSYLGEKI